MECERPHNPSFVVGHLLLLMMPTKQIRIRISDWDSEVVFCAEGINHVSASRELSWRLTQLLDDRFADRDQDVRAGDVSMAAVRMDLGEVSCLSSVGLNELISMNRKSKSLGLRFVLENVDETLRRILAITRVDRMFEFETV